MESALELGRRAALIKLAEGDMNLGARPAAPAVPAAPAASKPPASLNISMTMPRPAPAPPAPGGFSLGNIGQQLGSYFRKPANLAGMLGATGDIGKGLLGATGAPGLFALSNIPRGFSDVGSILRGGIPTGNG
jgi:hypothetical protein